MQLVEFFYLSNINFKYINNKNRELQFKRQVKQKT